MVFSTPFFITVFLPIALGGAWLLGILASRLFPASRWRWLPVNAFLLLCSLWFYFWGEGWGVFWLLLSVTANAVVTRVMMARPCERWRRGWLAVAVVGNLLFLGWFKYAGFFAKSLNLLPGVTLPVPEIALPLGISFYTFQAMSYVVDVYRGEASVARGFVDFACYVTMFPQLVAGPIVRYSTIAAQLRHRRIRLSMVVSGFRRFLYGLAKKVLIANTVAVMADGVWGAIGDGHAVGVSLAFLGLLCYSLQIYYDFSGYSDMAIGLGRMLGFEFLENFLHPYSATSVRDFWRKWHISLSTWFRDYLYIPLGGNRRGKARTALNGIIVFALCGFWHGASVMFILWGLWHGFFLSAERLLFGRRPGRSAVWARVAGHLYTIAVFAAGWVLFRSETLADASLMFQSLFGLVEPVSKTRALWLDWTPKMMIAVVAGVVFAYPVVPLAKRWLQRHVNLAVLMAADNLMAAALGLIAAIFTAGGAYNPFLYFRF